MALANRTIVAQTAMDMSDKLQIVFATRTLGKNPELRLSVSVPDGPSTGAGKQSRQSLTLTPAGDGQGPAVMIGWLDVSQNKAALRRYDVVAQTYERRYRRESDFNKDEYEEFSKAISVMLATESFQVSIDESAAVAKAPPPEAATQRVQRMQAPASNKTWLIVAAMGAVALLGIGLGAILF